MLRSSSNRKRLYSWIGKSEGLRLLTVSIPLGRTTGRRLERHGARWGTMDSVAERAPSVVRNKIFSDLHVDLTRRLIIAMESFSWEPREIISSTAYRAYSSKHIFSRLSVPVPLLATTWYCGHMTSRASIFNLLFDVAGLNEKWVKWRTHIAKCSSSRH